MFLVKRGLTKKLDKYDKQLPQYQNLGYKENRLSL
jgi:hypothetical protein